MDKQKYFFSSLAMKKKKMPPLLKQLKNLKLENKKELLFYQIISEMQIY